MLYAKYNNADGNTKPNMGSKDKAKHKTDTLTSSHSSNKTETRYNKTEKRYNKTENKTETRCQQDFFTFSFF